MVWLHTYLSRQSWSSRGRERQLGLDIHIFSPLNLHRRNAVHPFHLHLNMVCASLTR
jgi:hypothetical protein